MHDRRWWWLVGVVALVAIGVGVLLALDGSDRGTVHVTSAASTTPTTSATSTLPPTASTAAPATNGQPAPTTTPTTRPAVPTQVTGVQAGPAGGSGEIQLVWNVVPGATGYRVSRSTAATGPFSVSADFNVAAGTSTKDTTVVNLYADGARLVYVEVPATADPHRYYRVAAYNAGGEGAPSAVVCGAPVGYSAC